MTKYKMQNQNNSDNFSLPRNDKKCEEKICSCFPNIINITIKYSDNQSCQQKNYKLEKECKYDNVCIKNNSNDKLEKCCDFYQWRSLDGYANNLSHPELGLIGQQLLRKAKIGYADGISSLAVRGPKNPNPRIVSNAICKSSGSILNSNFLTDATWAWGQFMDHILDLTLDNTDEFINIVTPSVEEDPSEEFPNRTIQIRRNEFVLNSSPRQHPNNISGYIDATTVYGNDSRRLIALRRLDGTGKFKVGKSDNGEDLLIYNTQKFPVIAAEGVNTSEDLFLAGDFRANENIILTSMHTLFMREHNYLCDKIIKKRPEFIGKEELIFQHARRILIGEIQNINYNEFLPALLGPHNLDEYDGYDQNVDPSISIEFSTAGFRLGHTMLSSSLKIGTGGSILLRDAFFNPTYVQANGINQILYGIANQLMQEIDEKVIDDVRNFLFVTPSETNLLDLASINVQRGRDHGLPGYNDLREAFGLTRINNFADINSNLDVQNRLSDLYLSPDYIDPWIGVIVEDHLPGAAIGELAAAIIKDQFHRLRKGDRFYFENNSCLSEKEKRYIKKTKFSDIINRNTGLNLRPDIFHLYQKIKHPRR